MAVFVDALRCEAHVAPSHPHRACGWIGGSASPKTSFLTNRWGSAMQATESVNTPQWKPADIRERERGNRVPALRPRLRLLAQRLIEQRSFSASLEDCVHNDPKGRTHRDIGKAIGASKGYISKLMRSVWEEQAMRLIRFCRETRCASPVQKIADELGFELRVKPELDPREEA